MGIGAWATFKRTWRLQTTMQVATLSVLIGSFTVLTVAALVHQNVGIFLDRWGEKVRVSVYLKDGASQAETTEINRLIQDTPLFERKVYLSKRDAAEKFKARISQYAPGLLDDLDSENPIPASFEAYVAGGIQSSSKYELVAKAAEQLKKMTGVDEVSYGQGWVENYAAVLKVFSISSVLLIVVLLSGVLFVIGNSIRNSISQRRDEIELLELFGATRRAVLWPYIFEGLVMGLVSATVALGLTYLGFQWQIDLLAGQLSFWNIDGNIEFLAIWRAGLLIFTGAALGGFGSYLWARKINSGWAASEAMRS